MALKSAASFFPVWCKLFALEFKFMTLMEDNAVFQTGATMAFRDQNHLNCALEGIKTVMIIRVEDMHPLKW